VPLNDDIAAVLYAFEAARLTPPWAAASAREARESFERRIARLSENVPELAVGEVEDLSVPGGDGPLPARCYRPVGTPTGVIVFFHGGGYVLGSLNTHDLPSRRLCVQTNAVVLSVEYRKAPEHRFPAAVEDADAATTWACENREALGGHGDAPVVVSGVSAGGNLAAVVALEAAERGLELAAQVLIYPQTDSAKVYPSMVENADGYMLTRKDMEWFNEQYCPRALGLDRDPRRSPIYAPELRAVPPAYVVTAAFDPLRDEGIAYAARLAEAGNRVLLDNFDGTIHGFLGFADDVASARADIAVMCSRIRRLLSEPAQVAAG
jgi:acetyl esterase